MLVVFRQIQPATLREGQVSEYVASVAAYAFSLLGEDFDDFLLSQFVAWGQQRNDHSEDRWVSIADRPD